MRPSPFRSALLTAGLAVVSSCGCDSFDFGRVLGQATGLPSASAEVTEAPAPNDSVAPTAGTPGRADHLTVIVGGNIALGGNVRSWLGADKAYNPLAGLGPVLDGTDLRVASLISPISDRPAAFGKLVTPVGPSKAADALARAGLGVLAVANDELWSSGPGPFADTLANLARTRIAAAGASKDAGKADAPVELRIQGWSIALFAVTTWPDKDAAAREGRDHVANADAAKLAKAIHDARAHHDLVLVSHHGGPLDGESPSADQTTIARAAIEAGADAVFDHRARVPFGVGWISGHPVFYGLGNLIADEDPKDPWTGRSFLARIRFSADGGHDVDACPYLIVDSEPKLLTGGSRPTQEGIFRRAISRLSESLGGTDVGEPDIHSCMRLGVTAPAKPEP